MSAAFDLVNKLGKPLEWVKSWLVDSEGQNQLVFRCPVCAALVGDSNQHYTWHLKLER